MKQLSIKGLADYMTAGPHRQRMILRQFKYPAEDESRARILYYREARDRIRIFHGGGHRPAWLEGQAKLLEALGAESAGRTRTRLRHNARALEAYARHFGHKNYDLLDELVLDITFDDVRVTVVPELHVRERNAEKIVKLDFSKDPPEKAFIRTMSQALFEAATQANMGLGSRSVLYVDVTRGESHHGARMGAYVRRDIRAACEAISAIWDRI